MQVENCDGWEARLDSDLERTLSEQVADAAEVDRVTARGMLDVLNVDEHTTDLFDLAVAKLTSQKLETSPLSMPGDFEPMALLLRTSSELSEAAFIKLTVRTEAGDFDLTAMHSDLVGETVRAAFKDHEFSLKDKSKVDDLSVGVTKIYFAGEELEEDLSFEENGIEDAAVLSFRAEAQKTLSIKDRLKMIETGYYKVSTDHW